MQCSSMWVWPFLPFTLTFSRPSWFSQSHQVGVSVTRFGDQPPFKPSRESLVTYFSGLKFGKLRLFGTLSLNKTWRLDKVTQVAEAFLAFFGQPLQTLGDFFHPKHQVAPDSESDLKH